MKIQHIGKDQTITYYELLSILKATVEALDALPATVFARVSEEEKGAYEEMAGAIERVNNKTAELIAAMERRAIEVFEKADKFYTKTDETMREVNDKLGKLPSFRDIYIPTHQMQEAIEIAERLERLDDKNWNRVLELARALGGKTA